MTWDGRIQALGRQVERQIEGLDQAMAGLTEAMLADVRKSYPNARISCQIHDEVLIELGPCPECAGSLDDRGTCARCGWAPEKERRAVLLDWGREPKQT